MGSIDGIRLDRFDVGRVYDVGTRLASLFLAERWAEPVDIRPPAETPELVIASVPPGTKIQSSHDPANLIRKRQQPHLELQFATAADRQRRLRNRR
jgi:hypothetical protein